MRRGGEWQPCALSVLPSVSNPLSVLRRHSGCLQRDAAAAAAAARAAALSQATSAHHRDATSVEPGLNFRGRSRNFGHFGGTYRHIKKKWVSVANECSCTVACCSEADSQPSLLPADSIVRFTLLLLSLQLSGRAECLRADSTDFNFFQYYS